MYLKSLELQGFKSFVDKTVLEFGTGITAIVGPNGSGKSNVSDAVRWVLGEQSPRILRGSKMEDMIFAGTAARKSVGYAEVSMNIDNSDHALNIDYEEVKVTRRLYRSGESEYLINGANCRLKDITLLFADTGVGKDGYSIISQGRVDEILSNKSEERRRIFEDASGISKYRMRKTESERKLASTESNLVRINDIISELERQIGPLTKQAETAKQYLALKYELRDIEVGVLVDGISRANTRLNEIGEAVDSVNSQINEFEEKLVKEKSDNEEKTGIQKKLEDKISELKESGFEIERNIERINSEIKINEEKISSINENADRLTKDSYEYNGKNFELNRRIEEAKAGIEENNGKLDSVMNDLQESQNKYDMIMSLLSDDAAKAEQIKDSIVENKLKNEQSKGEISKLESNIEMLNDNIESLISEASTIDNQLKVLEEEKNRAEKNKSDVEKELEEAKNTHEGALAEINRLRAEIETLTAELSSVSSELQSKSARLKLLEEMEDNYEGYARSVKEILTFCKNNQKLGNGIYGAVAQLINVPQKYELAIEAALGSSYQNIVTGSEDDAKQAIEYLKANKYGRATFMPVTSAKERSFDSGTVQDLGRARGFLGVASEIIEYPSKSAPVIANLLGKVAVFDNLDNAIPVAKKYKYDFICVTLDGDILRTSGAITGGSPEKSKKTGALSRTRDIPVIREEVKNLTDKANNIADKINSNKSVMTEDESKAGNALAALRNLEISFAKIKSDAEARAFRYNESKERHDKILSDVEIKKADIERANNDIIDFNRAAEESVKSVLELEKELANYEEKAKSGAEVRNALLNEITEHRLKAQNINSVIEKFKEDIERFNTEIDEMNTKSQNITLEIDEDKAFVANLTSENETKKQQISELEATRNESADGLVEILEKKKAIDDDLLGMVDRITEITDGLSKLKEESGRLELKRMRAETELEQNTTRLWEEYELTVTKAAEVTGGLPVENFAQCQKQISILRKQIKDLGPVNVASIEELESTQTRYDFMYSQRKDMDEARTKLVKIIEEVDILMKEQFNSKFKEIRANFKQVFRDLFEGGDADIVLVDDTNVLESGIDIIVQPPGKKLQNMMLLSGGERALTAIALLFGILKMHPSPFCLLDEIEAALDDTNVYRFAHYLHVVNDNTQLLLITHKKGTMEVANSLYGVTMEEKGVSRTLSMKMEK